MMDKENQYGNAMYDAPSRQKSNAVKDCGDNNMYISSLFSKDTKQKLNGLSKTEEALRTGDVDLEFERSTLSRGLLNTLGDNNFRVCVGSLKCIQLLVEKDRTHFQPRQWIKSIAERMGDGKATVRDIATETARQMVLAFGTDLLVHHFSKLCFRHRKWRVREQAARLVMISKDALSRSNGARTVLEDAASVLGDSNKDVRAAAIDAVVAIGTFYSSDELMSLLESFKVRAPQLALVRDAIGERAPDVPVVKKTPAASKIKTQKSQRKRSVASRPSSRRGSNVENPPRIFSTASALAREIQSMRSTLQDKDAEWTQRRQLLLRLRDFVCTHADTHMAHECVLDALEHIRPALQFSLKDLRSSIVKEACSAIEVIAETLGPSFDSMAAPLVSTLLQLSFVKIAAMRDPALECMRTIVHSSTFGFKALLQLLVEKTTDRHNGVLRATATENVTLALRVWNPSFFSRKEKMLMNMLESTLTDKHAETRANARRCFKAFEIHFAESASDLRDRLPSATQKQLMRENALSPLPMRTKKSTVALPRPVSRRNGLRAGKRPSSQRDVHRKPLGSFTKLTTSKSTIRPHTSPRLSIATATARDVDDDLSDEYASTSPKSDAEERTRMVSFGPLTSSRRRLSIEHNVPPVSSRSSFGAPMRAMRVMNVNDNESSPSSTPSSDNTSSPSPSPVAKDDGMSTHSPSIDVSQLPELVAETSSESWASRESALSQILHTLQRVPSGTIRPSVWQSLFDAVRPTLNDGHYRVVHVTLELVESLVLTSSVSVLENNLKWLLSNVFKLASSSRRDTKEIAERCVQTISKSSLPPAIFLSSLVVALSSRKANICLQSLQFMLRTYHAKTSTGADAKIMREHISGLGVVSIKQIMKRVVNCMKHRSGQIQRSAVKLAMMFRSMSGEQTWISSVLMLSPAEQTELVRNLQREIPDLATQLVSAARKSNSSRRSDTNAETKARTCPRDEQVVSDLRDALSEKNVSSSESRQLSGLFNLLRVVTSGQMETWESARVVSVLRVLHDALRGSVTSKVSEKALYVLNQFVVSTSPATIADHVDILMDSLLGCAGHASTSVKYGAKNTLLILCKQTTSVDKCFDILLARAVSSDDDVQFLTILRVMTSLVPSLSVTHRDGNVAFFEPISRAINHENSEIRMVSVFFVVALYAMLGETFLTTLETPTEGGGAGLSEVHMMLIRTYITRLSSPAATQTATPRETKSSKKRKKKRRKSTTKKSTSTRTPMKLMR